MRRAAGQSQRQPGKAHSRAAKQHAGGLIGDVQLPSQGISPKVTTQAGLQLNLDSRTAAPTAATPASARRDSRKVSTKNPRASPNTRGSSTQTPGREDSLIFKRIVLRPAGGWAKSLAA